MPDCPRMAVISASTALIACKIKATIASVPILFIPPSAPGYDFASAFGNADADFFQDVPDLMERLEMLWVDGLRVGNRMATVRVLHVVSWLNIRHHAPPRAEATAVIPAVIPLTISITF